MPDQDRILIERFKKGDAAAFEKLFERYSGRIYNFSLRMCRHVEDAQDVLQDTFLAAIKGIRNFKGRSSLTTWLYKIASTACLKKRRRRKYDPKQVMSLESFMPDPEGRDGPLDIADWSRSAQDELQRKETREALEEAVAALPKEYRVVLILRDMEGLSAEETGRVLGLSVPAVKSRLHRARLFVRRRLSDHYEKTI